MAKICIVTTGHFSSNPRVWREADALSTAGHDISVTGIWFDPHQAELDREMLRSRNWQFRIAADLRGLRLVSRVRRDWSRLIAKTGRFLTRTGFWNPSSLGYGVGQLLRTAVQECAELTIVHLEPAMWVGIELDHRGFRVGVDFEDWYSEALTEVPPNFAALRFRRELERKILGCARHATTTSRAMATALQQAYSASNIETVYNSIPSVPSPPSVDSDDTLRLLWFSQTLGQDRGLQDVFAALPLLAGKWFLELRANSSANMRAWVESQVSPELRSRVRIEPTVPPEQLSDAVSRHDVGLALEQPLCRNKELTASNKIFQYLQSGLLIAATDTLGQHEVLKEIPLAGACYPARDSRKLATILNGWSRDLPVVRQRKNLIYREANARFSYQRQSERLINSVNRALEA